MESIVNQGKLVPDDVIVNILSRRLEKSALKGELGFILHGYPRTKRQAVRISNLLFWGQWISLWFLYFELCTILPIVVCRMVSWWKHCMLYISSLQINTRRVHELSICIVFPSRCEELGDSNKGSPNSDQRIKVLPAMGSEKHAFFTTLWIRPFLYILIINVDEIKFLRWHYMFQCLSSF